MASICRTTTVLGLYPSEGPLDWLSSLAKLFAEGKDSGGHVLQDTTIEPRLVWTSLASTHSWTREKRIVCREWWGGVLGCGASMHLHTSQEGHGFPAVMSCPFCRDEAIMKTGNPMQNMDSRDTFNAPFLVRGILCMPLQVIHATMLTCYRLKPRTLNTCVSQREPSH